MALRPFNLDDLSQGTIVVLSPHMDDGELGCGGTIARLPGKERIHFVYLTDGTRSPWPALPHLQRSAVGLGAIRRRESREAMRVFGLPPDNIHFLDFPEGRLEGQAEGVGSALRELLGRLQPDHLFMPFRYDRHPDHLTVHRAAIALMRNGTLRAEFYEYFVYFQSRLLPRGDIRRYLQPDSFIEVNIGAESHLKRQALECHRSQVSIFYSWQTAPILSAPLLEKFCAGPELFVPTRRVPEGTAVFASARLLIRLTHWLEPVLKERKDRLMNNARLWGRVIRDHGS